jgi:putative peptidoglycan lipid II flippase
VKPPETPEESGQDPQEHAAPEAADTAHAFVRYSAVMSVGTALSRFTGFLRVAAMAYALGVTESRLADAYNVANTTPNIVYELAVGGILASVLVPVFVERMRIGQEAAWHTARSVLTVALVVLSGVMVLGILGSGLIIRMYTVGRHGPEIEAERQLATLFLKWFMPQIVFYGLGAGVATGLLNANRRFAVPMFAPILNNLIVTATFFLFAFLPGPTTPTPSNITELQRYVLVIGTTLGVIAMTVALWPSLRRLGFRWRWRLDLRDAGLRRIGRLAGWVFVYVLANQIGYLVIIVLAAQVEGGYTAYTSAFIFFQLPHAIFAVSIMTALLPAMSSRWTDRDLTGFRDLLVQGIRGTAFIVFPAAFGYLALAVPVVTLLLQHGVMKEESTELVAHVLVFFSLGLFSFSAFQLLLRGFYAMQDTRTPALINLGSNAVNVLADIIFFRYLRVEGLALGHATAYTFATVVAGFVLVRRIGGLDWRRLLKGLGQIVLGGAATGLAAFAVSRLVAHVLGSQTLVPQLVGVTTGVLAGIATFVAVAAGFRMPELAVVRGLVTSRLPTTRGRRP